MTMELQTVVVGLLANVLGDQILIMLLSGAVHLWGRKCCSSIAAQLRGEGLAAPNDVMAVPEEASLLPGDAP